MSVRDLLPNPRKKNECSRPGRARPGLEHSFFFLLAIGDRQSVKGKNRLVRNPVHHHSRMHHQTKPPPKSPLLKTFPNSAPGIAMTIPTIISIAVSFIIIPKAPSQDAAI